MKFYQTVVMSSFMSQDEVDVPKRDNSLDFRTRELDLRDREIAAREREVTAKEAELKESKWFNPLTLGLIAAAIGLIGNAITTFINNQATKELEERRAQSALVVEVIKTGKPEEACKNLVAFVNLGLIKDPTNTIRGCSSNPSTSPVLPQPGVQMRHSLPPGSATCIGLDDLVKHVYHPERLETKSPCVAVTGTIANVKVEADGDYDMSLKLDPGQEDLLNEGNLTLRAGSLVLEAICEHTPRQADAVTACQDFLGPIKRPEIGQHVLVVGRYVLDTQHQWMEIHPVVSITETPQ